MFGERNGAFTGVNWKFQPNTEDLAVVFPLSVFKCSRQQQQLAVLISSALLSTSLSVHSVWTSLPSSLSVENMYGDVCMPAFNPGDCTFSQLFCM